MPQQVASIQRFTLNSHPTYVHRELLLSFDISQTHYINNTSITPTLQQKHKDSTDHLGQKKKKDTRKIRRGSIDIRIWMACFCFLVDQRRMMRRAKPVAGTCSRCGSGAKVADMQVSTRFCNIPLYWESWKAICSCRDFIKSITCK
uniref:Uncharacterized protein n=1 Tax=Daucus carota subsp. sativus TaxID=79200 RepID=A0A161WRD1_DAUCS